MEGTAETKSCKYYLLYSKETSPTGFGCGRKWVFELACMLASVDIFQLLSVKPWKFPEEEKEKKGSADAKLVRSPASR